MIVTKGDFTIAWDHTEPTVLFAVAGDSTIIATDLVEKEFDMSFSDGVHNIEVWAYWDSGDQTKWSSPASLEVEIRTVAPDPITNLRVVA